MVSAYLPTALLFTLPWPTPGQKWKQEPAHQCLSKDLHALGADAPQTGVVVSLLREEGEGISGVKTNQMLVP
jgi:hypothetical protein